MRALDFVCKIQSPLFVACNGSSFLKIAITCEKGHLLLKSAAERFLFRQFAYRARGFFVRLFYALVRYRAPGEILCEKRREVQKTGDEQEERPQQHRARVRSLFAGHALSLKHDYKHARQRREHVRNRERYREKQPGGLPHFEIVGLEKRR